MSIPLFVVHVPNIDFKPILPSSLENIVSRPPDIQVELEAVKEPFLPQVILWRMLGIPGLFTVYP